jgi:hypothetical protein
MMSRHDREGGVHGERRPAGQHVEMPQSEQESARSAERGIVSTSRLA